MLAAILCTALAAWPLAASGEPAVELAVTIDDLPTHSALPPGVTRTAIVQRIIQVLQRHGAPEVYGFANGGPVLDRPAHREILEAWSRAGFPLGNHTFSHLDLARVASAEFIRDIERDEEFLE